jgi:SulP family sulfate permease
MGVLVGVLLSGIFFAGKVKNMFTVERVRREHSAVYHVRGEIFFASVDRFVDLLGPESAYEDAAHHVVIDVSKAHFWDISAIGALEKVVERMRRNGRHTRVVGLNAASADLFDKFALEDRTGLELGLAPH